MFSRIPLTSRPPLRLPSPSSKLGFRTIRSFQTNRPFEPLRPPPPDSLGAPRAARTYPRTRRLLSRLAVVSSVLAGTYLVDRSLYGSSATRTLRTFGTGLVAAIDYKLNFRPVPWTGGTIQDLHERNAKRLADLMVANGGLYLKMGQAIAVQGQMMPAQFQRMFARMFDDAEPDDWKDVEAVIRDEFGGKSVEEVFGVSFTGEEGAGLFERSARASASIASVHWARLADGREVAVKIQKRDIAKQMAWDLLAYRTVMWIYSKWFDLPLHKFAAYISQQLQLEADFLNEGANAEKMRELVASEPRLKDRVYVPKVYWDLTSKRVMTAEWIEGVKLYDKGALTATWLGGYGKGTPGLGNSELEPPHPASVRRELTQRPLYQERLKPERQEWRGPRRKGGLGLQSTDFMTTIVDLFSAQIFAFSAIHCDPHPANIIIRRLPRGTAQVVLIDHGLYVHPSQTFRDQYARLWRALLTADDKMIQDITAEWGIKAPEMFASATLMRPYEGGDGRGGFGGHLSGKTPEERHFEMQQRMKVAIRDVLADEKRLPRELLFIGRNMKIVQGLNQRFGSPVNRIRIMGEWASRSIGRRARPDGVALSLPLGDRARLAMRHVLFEVVLLATDFAYWLVRVGAWLGVRRAKGGMEAVLERNMRDVARGMGVELQEDTSPFDG